MKNSQPAKKNQQTKKTTTSNRSRNRSAILFIHPRFLNHPYDHLPSASMILELVNRGEHTGRNSNSNGNNNLSKKPKLDPELLPANKHAPTALEKQRMEVAKLLQNPTREIHLPKAPRDKSIRPPREMMKNVQGSSAGAGSGEFHVYKQSRRREYERLRLMDENEEKASYLDRRTDANTEFEKKQADIKEQVEAKTNKNRLKRQKKKDLRKKKQTKDRPTNEAENDHEKKRKKLGAAPIAEGMAFRQPTQKSTNDEDENENENDEEADLGESPNQEVLNNTDNQTSTDVPIDRSIGLTIVDDE
ncbi:hypothetical protein PSHT_01196 [Puccinia striiformis]|uniref:DUF1168-domain-containing protein n=1 Tax=Puccinia striiformis TaxID=27350 RepID=A0A2S4WL18_9BASI|nr:hypothetical protein PSHT_01196 [Puccinia striiformis]